MADDDVLVGPRVAMRRPRIEDAEAIFQSITSDPRVTEYLSWTPHPDVAETRRVLTELFNVGHDHTWLITMRNTQEVIGQLGYRRPRKREAELGYCLAARWWSRGLMSEAVGVIMQHLQQDSRLDRVTAAVHLANTRSARVLEHCGFTMTGTLPRHTVFPNFSPEPQDCLLYERKMMR